jgi:glutaredoxin-like protein NrdH
MKIPVTVWTTPNCVKCNATKRMMDKLGIEYTVKDLTADPEKLAEFKEAGHMVAPIVTTDTKVWSDFRPVKIESLANHIRSLRRAE